MSTETATSPAAPATIVVEARRPRSAPSVLTRILKQETGVFGLIITTLIVLVAILAPFLAPADPGTQSLAARQLPPFWVAGSQPQHIFGTDSLGRDLISRVIFGTRISLLVAGAAVVAASIVGISLGLIAGYFRGWVDGVLMRVADVQLSFPYLLFAIAVIAVLGPSLPNLILVLALRSWVVYARVVRGQTLSIRNRDFVQAARAVGASDGRVMLRHVAPNVLGPVIVISSFQFAELIIAESSLSFLGLGVQPPTPSWGAMLSQAREYMTTAWWLAALPGLAIVLTVLGSNLLGDALRDALDPRMKHQ